MLRLKLPTEPYWIDLPHGVSVKVRPPTTALLASARSVAVRKVMALMEDIKTRTLAGAPTDGLPDLNDHDTRAGYSHFMGIVAVARAAIVEWKGVAPAEGDGLAKITEETVADLMRVSTIGENFYDRYFESIDNLVAEGNASRPAPNGTGGAGPAIAQDADTQAPDAPQENGELTATAAPISNTIQ